MMSINNRQQEVFTAELEEHISNRLVELGAPELYDFEPINRAGSFLEFNQWFKNLEQEVIDQLSKTYGLSLLIYILNGYDHIHATFSTDELELDYSGFIRYIDSIVKNNSQNESIQLNKLGKALYGEKFRFDRSLSMRQDLIERVLEELVNREDTIDEDVLGEWINHYNIK